MERERRMRGGGGVGLLHGLKNEPNKRAVQIRRRGQTRLLYLTVEYNYFLTQKKKSTITFTNLI